jgi:hypothetical protein
MTEYRRISTAGANRDCPMLDTAPQAEAAAWLRSFATALESRDIAAVLDLFAADCYWRDIIAFTWNVKTLEGKPAIEGMLRATLANTAPTAFELGEVEKRASDVQAWFKARSSVGQIEGIVRLEGGKARTILTTLQSLTGHEEATGFTRPMGVRHGADRNRKTWSEQKAVEEQALGTTQQPYVVIIGGGQGGIMLGARLKQLGVPAIILEKNDKPGDSWRNRYRSLVLHDPVWYDHLPYIPFPAHWPVFTPKDQMGDWLEMYVKVMGLTYWTGSEAFSAQFDDAEKRWTVNVLRNGVESTLHPAHLVFATGAYGPPKWLDLPGASDFQGEILHSSQYSDGARFKKQEGRCHRRRQLRPRRLGRPVGSWRRRHHDPAQPHHRRPLRNPDGPRLRHLLRAGDRRRHRRRQGRPDSRGHALRAPARGPARPLRAHPRPRRRLLPAPASHWFPSRFRRRRHRPDDEGLPHRLRLLRRCRRLRPHHHRRHQGEGRRRHRHPHPHRHPLRRWHRDRRRRHHPVHRLQSMHEVVAQLVDRRTADAVGPCWGLGSGHRNDPLPWHGELRNMYKPTAQQNLWFQGGNLALSRFFSKFLALQLKARYEGIPTPVYAPPLT